MNTKTLNQVLLGTIALLFVAFAGQVGYEYWFNKPKPVVLASYAFEPRNLAEAKGLSKEIVEAQVTKVERADDLVFPVQGEPGGVERIAIEVVSMRVKGAMKGQPGQEVRVFRTAGIPVTRNDMPPMSEAPPRPKGAPNPPSRPTPFVENTVNLHDAQEYKVGENYVMFLRDGPQVKVRGQRVATKSLLNPNTRFRVEKDNRVMPIIPDGMGAPYRGKPLEHFKRDIQQTPEIGPIPGKIPGQMILPALKAPTGGIRPRGIDGGDMPQDMEAMMGEVEVPTAGEAPQFQ